MSYCPAHGAIKSQPCPLCALANNRGNGAARPDGSAFASTDWLGEAPPETPESKAAGWWFMGWLRSYQETPDEHAQLIPRLIAAEKRYERVTEGGGTGAVNGASPSGRLIDGGETKLQP